MSRARPVLWRALSGLAWTLAALAALLLASFAVPLPEWRTGRAAVAPLDLTHGGPAVDMPDRIWIDTDAACGHGETTDPDDCFAILSLARSPAVRVVGISTVHGNAPLQVTDATTRELAARLAAPGSKGAPVFRGSARPLGDGPVSPAPAHAALRDALRRGPLTLVSLGPLTNVAAALIDEPTLRANVARVVAVMGRRPGHLFHPAEGKGSNGLLFGHGPVFSDFNFEKDRAAAAALLGMGLPITLVPYDAARAATVTAADLARMRQEGGAAAWVAARARDWLRFWNERVGLDGFYPFDLMAAAYVLDPGRFDCARTVAWIANDDRLWKWFYNPESLLVGPPSEKPARVAAHGRLIYCPRTDLTVAHSPSSISPLTE